MRLHAIITALALCLCAFRPVEAQQSRQLMVEDVELVGTAKTLPEVVLRYLTVAPGGPIVPRDLLVSRQRLEETEFFKQVDVYTRPGSRKGWLVVVVEVEERKWPYYRFEGGYGELDGWYIVPVGFHFDNFSGRGHRLDWKWRIGDRISKTSLHYQHPYLFSERGILDIFTFDQGQYFYHYIQARKIDVQVHSEGIILRLSGREGIYRRAFLALRTQQYRPDSEPQLAGLFDDDFADIRVSSLAAGLQVDTRDNPYFPQKGVWGRLSAELAVAPLGSDVEFPRLELDARIFRALGGRQVFATHLHAGYVGEEAPFFERYYLGGPHSLRGYPSGRLTPVGWGTKLLLLQSEMRFPLSTERFPEHRHTGAVYYDLGGIWTPGELPGPSGLSHSLGVGYRLRLKVLGMLRVDFSLPLGDVDEYDFRFQIALGDAF